MGPTLVSCQKTVPLFQTDGCQKPARGTTGFLSTGIASAGSPRRSPGKLAARAVAFARSPGTSGTPAQSSAWCPSRESARRLIAPVPLSSPGWQSKRPRGKSKKGNTVRLIVYEDLGAAGQSIYLLFLLGDPRGRDAQVFSGDAQSSRAPFPTQNPLPTSRH